MLSSNPLEVTYLHLFQYYQPHIIFHCSLYSVAQDHKENFEKLNSIRNKLTHLGSNSQEEYYILADRIADILNYVHYNIIMKIEYLPTTLDAISLEIFNIESVLSNLEKSIWRIANESRIKEICNYIINLSDCEEIQKYLEGKNIVGSFGSTFDAEYVYCIYTMKKDDDDKDICAIYASVQNNALFISDSELNDGPVFTIIPLNELNEKQPKFYISLDDEGNIIPEFQGQSNFWKTKPYSSHFAYVPYGKNKMIEMLSGAITRVIWRILP